MTPAGAVLDVRLREGEIYPAADELSRQGVPLIFHSGHATAALLGARYPDATFCEKPRSPDRLPRAIVKLPGVKDDAVQGSGADRVFDGVAVKLDAAIGQEATGTVAVSGDIDQRLAQGCFGERTGTMMAESGIDTGQDRQYQ